MGLCYFCFQKGAFRRPLPSNVIALRFPVKFVLVLAEVEMADGSGSSGRLKVTSHLQRPKKIVFSVIGLD